MWEEIWERNHQIYISNSNTRKKKPNKKQRKNNYKIIILIIYNLRRKKKVKSFKQGTNRGKMGTGVGILRKGRGNIVIGNTLRREEKKEECCA